MDSHVDKSKSSREPSSILGVFSRSNQSKLKVRSLACNDDATLSMVITDNSGLVIRQSVQTAFGKLVASKGTYTYPAISGEPQSYNSSSYGNNSYYASRGNGSNYGNNSYYASRGNRSYGSNRGNRSYYASYGRQSGSYAGASDDVGAKGALRGASFELTYNKDKLSSMRTTREGYTSEVRKKGFIKRWFDSSENKAVIARYQSFQDLTMDGVDCCSTRGRRYKACMKKLNPKGVHEIWESPSENGRESTR